MSPSSAPERDSNADRPPAPVLQGDDLRRAIWMLAAEDAEVLAAIHRIERTRLAGPTPRAVRRRRTAP